MKYLLGSAPFFLAALLALDVPRSHSAAIQVSTPSYKADVRLVEVFATVLDQKGRRVSNLTRDSFEVYDNGVIQPIVSFETTAAELSCAILLDTTRSMADALPSLKNATASLIDQLRDKDWFAVYGFNTSLNRLHDFTRDKEAGKRVVMSMRPGGATALFDAISRVAGELSKRKGKKCIIVFTDGMDNSSYLNADAAVAQARKAGVPLYAVAQGEALKKAALIDLLDRIAQSTGGLRYTARRPNEIKKSFAAIWQDVMSTYMLTYAAPPAEGQKWRTIQVAIRSPHGLRARAKEGYSP